MNFGNQKYKEILGEIKLFNQVFDIVVIIVICLINIVILFHCILLFMKILTWWMNLLNIYFSWSLRFMLEIS